jgi:exodeoxyribonuclease-3
LRLGAFARDKFLKIATWNVNSLKVRLPQVLEWLVTEQPDILGLQETKLPDDRFPVADIEAAGYRVSYAGQKTYNGVALLSRIAAGDVVTDLPGLADPQRRVLAASFGKLRVLNLYVPNGQAVDSDKYVYKLDWLAKLRDFLADELGRHAHLVMMGDFNIAPADRDVHDPKAWEGSVLCSDAERAALRALAETGVVDVFRQFEQPDGAFSWWDYRMNAFRRNLGLRIDLILASDAMSRRCTACRIDVEPRRNERPSDHAPVIAEFDLKIP